MIFHCQGGVIFCSFMKRFLNKMYTLGLSYRINLIKDIELFEKKAVPTGNDVIGLLVSIVRRSC